MAARKQLSLDGVRRFLESLVENDVHAMRVLSMANATLGVLTSASLAVHAIGQGLARARGLINKHAVKQVDRLLSNTGIDVWSYFAYWVPYVIGPRREIWVALDWTEFDRDNHSTIVLSLITRHGRATPLLWKSVRKDSLKLRNPLVFDAEIPHQITPKTSVKALCSLSSCPNLAINGSKRSSGMFGIRS